MLELLPQLSWQPLPRRDPRCVGDFFAATPLDAAHAICVASDHLWTDVNAALSGDEGELLLRSVAMASGSEMRFFIHTITNDDRIIDEEGANFPSAAAALREAERGAREIMAAEILAGGTLPLDWIAEVTDEDNVVVGRATFLDFVRPSRCTPVVGEPAALANNIISRNRELGEGLMRLNRQLNLLSEVPVSERSSGALRPGCSDADPKGLRDGTK